MFACYTEQITSQNQIIKISSLWQREAAELRHRRGAHYSYNAELISDISHSIPSLPESLRMRLIPAQLKPAYRYRHTHVKCVYNQILYGGQNHSLKRAE